MDVAVHRPGPALVDCVETIVHFSGFDPDWQREKLLPDGRIELVVDLTERSKRLFRTEQGTDGEDFRRAWISGVHRRPIVIEAQPLAAMLVIAFRPGGAAPFFGGDVHPLSDRVTTLDDVIGSSAANLRDRILEAPSPLDRCRLAESWLLKRAGGFARRDPLVAFLSRELALRPTSIRTLMDRAGHSHRHIQALARRSFGIPLKAQARIERFQRVLRDVRGADDWAELAQAHGYADQPHLYHDFRAFAGMTPTAYATRYPGLVDFLPIRVAPCANLQDDLPGRM